MKTLLAFAAGVITGFGAWALLRQQSHSTAQLPTELDDEPIIGMPTPYPYTYRVDVIDTTSVLQP